MMEETPSKLRELIAGVEKKKKKDHYSHGSPILAPPFPSPLTSPSLPHEHFLPPPHGKGLLSPPSLHPLNEGESSSAHYLSSSCSASPLKKIKGKGEEGANLTAAISSPTVLHAKCLLPQENSSLADWNEMGFEVSDRTTHRMEMQHQRKQRRKEKQAKEREKRNKQDGVPLLGMQNPMNPEYQQWGEEECMQGNEETTRTSLLKRGTTSETPFVRRREQGDDGVEPPPPTWSSPIRGSAERDQRGERTGVGKEMPTPLPEGVPLGECGSSSFPFPLLGSPVMETASREVHRNETEKRSQEVMEERAGGAGEDGGPRRGVQWQGVSPLVSSSSPTAVAPPSFSLPSSHAVEARHLSSPTKKARGVSAPRGSAGSGVEGAVLECQAKPSLLHTSFPLTEENTPALEPRCSTPPREEEVKASVVVPSTSPPGDGTTFLNTASEIEKEAWREVDATRMEGPRGKGPSSPAGTLLSSPVLLAGVPASRGHVFVEVERESLSLPHAEARDMREEKMKPLKTLRAMEKMEGKEEKKKGKEGWKGAQNTDMVYRDVRSGVPLLAPDPVAVAEEEDGKGRRRRGGTGVELPKDPRIKRDANGILSSTTRIISPAGAGGVPGMGLGSMSMGDAGMANYYERHHGIPLETQRKVLVGGLNDPRRVYNGDPYSFYLLGKEKEEEEEEAAVSFAPALPHEEGSERRRVIDGEGYSSPRDGLSCFHPSRYASFFSQLLFFIHQMGNMFLTIGFGTSIYSCLVVSGVWMLPGSVYSYTEQVFNDSAAGGTNTSSGNTTEVPLGSNGTAMQGNGEAHGETSALLSLEANSTSPLAFSPVYPHFRRHGDAVMDVISPFQSSFFIFFSLLGMQCHLLSTLCQYMVQEYWRSRERKLSEAPRGEAQKGRPSSMHLLGTSETGKDVSSPPHGPPSRRGLCSFLRGHHSRRQSHPPSFQAASVPVSPSSLSSARDAVLSSSGSGKWEGENGTSMFLLTKGGPSACNAISRVNQQWRHGFVHQYAPQRHLAYIDENDAFENPSSLPSMSLDSFLAATEHAKQQLSNGSKKSSCRHSLGNFFGPRHTRKKAKEAKTAQLSRRKRQAPSEGVFAFFYPHPSAVERVGKKRGENAKQEKEKGPRRAPQEKEWWKEPLAPPPVNEIPFSTLRKKDRGKKTEAEGSKLLRRKFNFFAFQKLAAMHQRQQQAAAAAGAAWTDALRQEDGVFRGGGGGWEEGRREWRRRSSSGSSWNTAASGEHRNLEGSSSSLLFGSKRRGPLGSPLPNVASTFSAGEWMAGSSPQARTPLAPSSPFPSPSSVHRVSYSFSPSAEGHAEKREVPWLYGVGQRFGKGESEEEESPEFPWNEATVGSPTPHRDGHSPFYVLSSLPVFPSLRQTWGRPETSHARPLPLWATSRPIHRAVLRREEEGQGEEKGKGGYGGALYKKTIPPTSLLRVLCSPMPKERSKEPFLAGMSPDPKELTDAGALFTEDCMQHGAYLPPYESGRRRRDSAISMSHWGRSDLHDHQHRPMRYLDPGNPVSHFLLSLEESSAMTRGTGPSRSNAPYPYEAGIQRSLSPLYTTSRMPPDSDAGAWGYPRGRSFATYRGGVGGLDGKGYPQEGGWRGSLSYSRRHSMEGAPYSFYGGGGESGRGPDFWWTPLHRSQRGWNRPSIASWRSLSPSSPAPSPCASSKREEKRRGEAEDRRGEEVGPEPQSMYHWGSAAARPSSGERAAHHRGSAYLGSPAASLPFPAAYTAAAPSPFHVEGWNESGALGWHFSCFSATFCCCWRPDLTVRHSQYFYWVQETIFSPRFMCLVFIFILSVMEMGFVAAATSPAASFFFNITTTTNMMKENAMMTYTTSTDASSLSFPFHAVSPVVAQDVHGRTRETRPSFEYPVQETPLSLALKEAPSPNSIEAVGLTQFPLTVLSVIFFLRLALFCIIVLLDLCFPRFR